MFRIKFRDDVVKGLWKEFSFTQHTYPKRMFHATDYALMDFHRLLSKEKKENLIQYQDGFNLIFQLDRSLAQLFLPDLKNQYVEGNYAYGCGQDVEAMTLCLDVYAYGTFLELICLAISEGFNYVDIEYVNNQLILKWDTLTARINGCKPVDMLVPTTKKPPYQPMKYHLFQMKNGGRHIYSKEHGTFSTNAGTCLTVTKGVSNEFDYSDLDTNQTRTEEQYQNLIGDFVDKVDGSTPLPDMDVNQLVQRCPKKRKVKYYNQKHQMYCEGWELPYPFVYYTDSDGYAFGYIVILMDDKTGQFVREVSRWMVKEDMKVIGFIQKDLLDTVAKFDYGNQGAGIKGVKVKDTYEFGVVDLGHRIGCCYVRLDSHNMVLSPFLYTHSVYGKTEKWYQYVLDNMPHTLV